jgi:hypothetical protein
MSTIRPTNSEQAAVIHGQGLLKTGMDREDTSRTPEDKSEISGKDSEEEKKWSVLVYMNGNNNLSKQAAAKLDYQLKKLDKSDGMNIAVHYSALDRAGYHHPNAIKSTRYEIGNNSARKIEELGPLDMGDSKTLGDFIEWGMKKYPAKHYMVVLQGHGSAWKGAMPDSVYDSQMSVPEISRTLGEVKNNTGETPDVLAFDTCLMGNVESAYELKDAAEIMIGSQEVEWGIDSPYAHDVSAPYRKIFNTVSKQLDEGVEVGPEAMAEGWVKACENNWTTPTTTAFNLNRMDSLAGSIDNLAKAILEGDTSLEAVRDIANDTKHMYGGKVDKWTRAMEKNIYLKDLFEFTEKLADDPRITDPGVRDACIDVQKNLMETVIAHQAGSDYNVVSTKEYGEPSNIVKNYDGHRNHGFSIFIPTNSAIVKNLEKEKDYPVKYGELSFIKETAWGKLCEKLAEYDDPGVA